MDTKLLPCPFCGKEMDINDSETLHNSGIYYRDFPDGYREYVSFRTRLETDNPCKIITCVGHMGGCNASITGDTEEEVINKWNARVK